MTEFLNQATVYQFRSTTMDQNSRMAPPAPPSNHQTLTLRFGIQGLTSSLYTGEAKQGLKVISSHHPQNQQGHGQILQLPQRASAQHKVLLVTQILDRWHDPREIVEGLPPHQLRVNDLKNQGLVSGATRLATETRIVVVVTTAHVDRIYRLLLIMTPFTCWSRLKGHNPVNIMPENPLPRPREEEHHPPPWWHEGEILSFRPSPHHDTYLWLGYQPSLHIHWFEHKCNFQRTPRQIEGHPLPGEAQFGIGQDVILTIDIVILPLMLIGTTAYKTLDCYYTITELLVLDLPSSFNAIIDWPSLIKFNLRCDIHSLTLIFKTQRGDTFIYAPSSLPVTTTWKPWALPLPFTD